MIMSRPQSILLPYKSMAVGLLFSIILGPLGLLYASFWGGVILLPFAIFVMINKFYFIALLIWVTCSILSVRAIEKYNQQLMRVIHTHDE